MDDEDPFAVDVDTSGFACDGASPAKTIEAAAAFAAAEYAATEAAEASKRVRMRMRMARDQHARFRACVTVTRCAAFR